MVSRRPLLNMVTGARDGPDINIAVIGPNGVGKSAFAVKYLTKRFIMEYDPYLEDTYQKAESIDGQEVCVRIMDTYDTPEKSRDRFLKWAHGLLVVYSITNRNSFQSAHEFLELIEQYEKDTGKTMAVGLVANKVDLERYRTVNKCAGEELAAKYDCHFHETSAADDFMTIELTVHELLREILRTNDKHVPLLPLFITEENRTSLSTGTSGRSVRRLKSPQTTEIKDGRSQDKDGRLPSKKTPSTFKIFNKRFNLFN